MTRWQTARRFWRHRLRVAIAAVTALAAAAGIAACGPAQADPGNRLLRPSGIPASVPTRLANMMALDSLPGRAAPGFAFTDQAGRTMSLASLRGKVVVLEFMDPHCTDICPIVSREFVEAYHDLGPAAARVVFAAVNVNQYHASVQAVAAFSREQRLSAIPDWHFFTGRVPALRATWHAYDIEVQAPGPDADIVHTSAIYFIDSRGRERFLASPEVDHTRNGASYLPAGQITGWGHGIADLARAMMR